MNYTPETRIIDLTVSQLMELIENTMKATRTEPEKEKRLVYGIAGIASVFGCSIATANRIKKSGVIKDAIMQDKRLIIVDADRAVELWKEHKSI